MDLIKKYIFESYPLEVILSNKIKAKPYDMDKDKIPKHIVNNIGIMYDVATIHSVVAGKKIPKQIVVNIMTGEMIPRNAKVGMKRTHKISGQQLHELTLPPYIRSKIVETLKEYFVTNMINQGKVECSNLNNLYIELLFETDEGYLSTYGKPTENYIEDESLGDLDNHELFYKKVLFDCLQSNLYRKFTTESDNPIGFLPYDNVRYINDWRIIYKNKKNCNNLTMSIYDKINS